MGKRVIGYARVSTTKQDLVRQRDKISKFCVEKEYELITILEDFGISGATLDRVGYQKLNSLDSSDCDIIVVSEISRLSRKEQITDALNDIQNILKKGISVILLDNSSKIYKANEDLKLEELLILIFQLYGAAQERTEIKRKNQDGKQALFKANPYAVVDCKIPYGYKKVPNNSSNKPRYLLEEDPEQVKVVKKIFELVLSGKTLYGVMEYLNERNIRINNGLPSVPLLSKIIHNDLYRGIRTRKQSFGKNDIAVQHISPIISEDDFLRAGECIRDNNKFVQTGKVYWNPLKGIIRCRCGRSMLIKDKKPRPNESKLTYRCSCNESRNSPAYCTYKIDEVSYEFTNSVIKSLFVQEGTRIAQYFKKIGTSRIDELKDILDGIDKKIEYNKERRINIQKDIESNINMFLTTKNPTFVIALEDKQTKLEEKRKIIEDEHASLIKNRINIINKINELDRTYRNIDGRKQAMNPTNDDLSEIYHSFLEKIEYHAVTIMKGFYKVYYKTGNYLFIAVSKVRYSPQAFLINGNGDGKCTVDVESGDINYYYEVATPNSDINNLNFEFKPISGVVNIRNFFDKNFDKEPFAIELGLDLSYRNRN